MGILDGIARRSIERQGSLVSRPESMRQERAKLVALLALVLFASSAPIWSEPGSWPAVLASFLLAVLAGSSVVGILRVKLAYRSGWLDGRAAMVRALSEAMGRGMSPQAWLEGELARDYAVLGLDPELARGLEDEEDGES